MTNYKTNPFNLTRSADMTDEQIDQLWVDLSLADINKIISPVAVIIKGGKGSGKTHLLRHYSFPLQKIRYVRDNAAPFDGILKDGYVGIYLRCGGLNASRFQGKGQSTEKWAQLFEYSCELLLGQELMHVLQSVFSNHPDYNRQIAKKVSSLFDREPEKAFASLSDVDAYLDRLRRKLDYAINNCALGVDLAISEDARVNITRGRIIFGLPALVHKLVPQFNNVSFVYLLDELENFTLEQQQYINTLIREKVPPVSIKVGVRKYGIKTLRTLSDGEELIEGSEYETLPLDQKLRDDQSYYKDFAYELIKSRLRPVVSPAIADQPQELFESIELSWNNHALKKILLERDEDVGFHLQELFENIKKNTSLDKEKITQIVDLLRVPDLPLIEKTNAMNFYRMAKLNSDLEEIAKVIKVDCEEFLAGDAEGTKTKKTWSYYQQNITHQLLHDYGLGPFYCGIDSFIEMSEGMPRNLLNIMKHLYDWAIFKGINFNEKQKHFSLEIQRKGVKKSADWFFKDMRKAGNDGQYVEVAIKRLAELMKVNHYADRPAQCSAITFGIDLSAANPEAQRIIHVAEERSLLIEGNAGYKDKNFGNELKRYQLSKMLSPRWDLPISARGTIKLTAEEANTIFDCANHSEDIFKQLLRKWHEKMAFNLKTDIQSGFF